MIIQPVLQRFVYYDVYRGQPGTVVPVISDCLTLLHTNQGLIPATPVNSCGPLSAPLMNPSRGVIIAVAPIFYSSSTGGSFTDRFPHYWTGMWKSPGRTKRPSFHSSGYSSQPTVGL